MASDGRRDFLRVVLAYFVPPIGVFLQTGVGSHLVINIVLCFLGWIPGIIHAVWIIATLSDDGTTEEAGNRTFLALLLGWALPPAGIFLAKGMAIGPILIASVLTLLGWFPGQLYAAWAITAEA